MRVARFMQVPRPRRRRRPRPPRHTSQNLLFHAHSLPLGANANSFSAAHRATRSNDHLGRSDVSRLLTGCCPSTTPSSERPCSSSISSASVASPSRHTARGPCSRSKPLTPSGPMLQRKVSTTPRRYVENLSMASRCSQLTPSSIRPVLPGPSLRLRLS